MPDKSNEDVLPYENAELAEDEHGRQTAAARWEPRTDPWDLGCHRNGDMRITQRVGILRALNRLSSSW